MRTKWVMPDRSAERIERIRWLRNTPELKGLSLTALNVLVNRGIDSPDKIVSFLEDDIMKQHNPMDLMDAERLVLHLKRAIEEGRHIVVYGDYDCDGVCATALSVLCLRNLGARVDYFINDRFKHGFGISPEGVRDLHDRYPTVDVILTVDNGIVGFAGVDEAKKLGLTVLISDHHEPDPSGVLPNADAVVNPKRPGDAYPFKAICGTAVAYKIMLYLYLMMDRPLEYVYSMVDLVGMATVGDVMPLIDENRLFVKESIRLVNRNPRYAFEVLKEITNKGTVDEGVYGFTFVPMINALGRMKGTVDEAVRLFLSTDRREVERLARYLYQVNEARKEMTGDQEKMAVRLIEEKGVGKAIVIAHESFHEGIVGLVAGRIKERYHRPAVVLTKGDDGVWKGSGRSIDGFNIIESLYELSEYLHHFGGHESACGLGVKEGKLDLFSKAFQEVAAGKLSEEDLLPKLYIDAVLPPEGFTERLVEDLERLRPYGQGFEEPNIAVKGFKVENYFSMGKNGAHLKLKNGSLEIIMWHGVDHYIDTLKMPGEVVAVGYPRINYWNGTTSVQLIVKGDNLIAL